MGLFAPRKSAIENHFGLVSMEELQRLERQKWDGYSLQAITDDLHSVLFEVANRLSADTLRVKCDDAFQGVDPEQKEMLIRLGALERVQRHGLSGPGRKEPFDDDHQALAVQSLAKAEDVERLRNGNQSGSYAALEEKMRERLDRALDDLARRVSMRGKEKKNGNDWTCFTLEDRQALLATIALEDALAKGRPGFVRRNWGKGLILGTALGGLAVAHAYPEQVDAAKMTINAAVSEGLGEVSPEAATWWKGHYILPTEPQARAWFESNVLPYLESAPEEAPESEEVQP